MNLFDLSGETAVVVGGTGELGGALALGLARQGARVALVGRDAGRGAERVARINQEVARQGESFVRSDESFIRQNESLGQVDQSLGHANQSFRQVDESLGQVGFWVADALNRSALESARAAIEAQLGAVSILVNAAGGNKAGATLPAGADFCALEQGAWDEVFDLNLVGGALLPCQVWGAGMVARGRGSIINIASLSGMTPLSRVVAYSAAKAAVLNLTQFLAREWAPYKVRVNALSPGFFPAEQNHALLQNPDGTLSPRGQAIIGHTPMARFGKPDELAGAVVFLASEKASGFVTGHNLVVDGGFSATTI